MILKVLPYSKCLCVWVSEHKVSRDFFSEFSSKEGKREKGKERERERKIEKVKEREREGERERWKKWKKERGREREK